MDPLFGLSEPWAYLLIGGLAAAEASAFVGLFLPGEAAMLLGGVLAYQGRGLPWGASTCPPIGSRVQPPVSL